MLRARRFARTLGTSVAGDAKNAASAGRVSGSHLAGHNGKQSVLPVARTANRARAILCRSFWRETFRGAPHAPIEFAPAMRQRFPEAPVRGSGGEYRSEAHRDRESLPIGPAFLSSPWPRLRSAGAGSSLQYSENA